MTTAERDKLLIRLDIGLNGNGVKGLNDRVDDLEVWIGKRPQECPAQKPDRLTILKQRAMEVSIMGGIVGIVVVVLKVFL